MTPQVSFFFVWPPGDISGQGPYSMSFLSFPLPNC
jgi:hypothetical protein